MKLSAVGIGSAALLSVVASVGLAATELAAARPRASGAGSSAPLVGQMVVLPDGDALTKRVRAARTRVRLGRRRCGVLPGTALAALVRSRPGRIGLRAFPSCSRRGRDNSGLFVRSIRGVTNRGQDGWVYKVGRRAATAGAADPAGPFGSGRLRTGQRVTWFYGRLRQGSFQRTLELRVASRATGSVVAVVRGFDDRARGVVVEGATLSAVGGPSAETDARGRATLPLGAGRHTLVARKAGLVRSFPERVTVPR